MKPNDYIFCPFCGNSKWITDKTGYDFVSQGKLTYNKCSGCKKFIYINLTRKVDHPFLKDITEEVRFKLQAEIGDYYITVNYIDGYTEFLENGKLALKLNQVINFNWYKHTELLEKIKTYLVFS